MAKRTKVRLPRNATPPARKHKGARRVLSVAKEYRSEYGTVFGIFRDATRAEPGIDWPERGLCWGRRKLLLIGDHLPELTQAIERARQAAAHEIGTGRSD